MDTLSMAPVRDLLDALDTADIRASEDIGELVPPAVWVRVKAFTAVTLTGWEVATDLVAVVPASDAARSADELVVLANRVLEVVDPDGPVTSGVVQLSTDPTLLPALVIPVNLTT